MKAITITLLVGLTAQVYGAACPFELLKRSGLLSEEDTAKFEAVKRDPKAAETLFEARRRDANPQLLSGLTGPISNGILDLPLGGGLCKSSYPCYTGSTE